MLSTCIELLAANTQQIYSSVQSFYALFKTSHHNTPV